MNPPFGTKHNKGLDMKFLQVQSHYFVYLNDASCIFRLAWKWPPELCTRFTKAQPEIMSCPRQRSGGPKQGTSKVSCLDLDANGLQGPCGAKIWPSCNLQASQESLGWHPSRLYQIHPLPNFLAKHCDSFFFLFLMCNVPAAAIKEDSHFFRFCLLWFNISKLSSRWAGRAMLMTR